DITNLHAGTTQKEILRGLLAGGSEHCGRIALFVVKAGTAAGWQSRGFADDDALKDFPLDMNAGPVMHAYQNRVATPANSAEMDSRFVEQFAGHAPKHIAPSIPVEPEQGSTAEVVEMPGSAHSAGAAAPAAAADPFAELSPEDADVHRKAQRFARLLVDEIKLYNQAKVTEGRKNKDLYDRLKDEIEKSRATYQKRYGTTVAAAADYFNQEIVRSLAEDDGSLMGANF